MGWSMTTDGIENIFRMFLERNDISSTTYYPSIMDLGVIKGGTETGLWGYSNWQIKISACSTISLAPAHSSDFRVD